MYKDNDYLKVLIDYFTEYIGDNFDISLSREYMKFLTQLIDQYTADELSEQLNEFVRMHKDEWLSSVDRLRLTDRNYLVQPELLLMLYLLDKDPHILREILDGEIPYSDVDQIFYCMGIPADDYRI
jgi:uncharacterized ubiquitin-like protein YukD